MFRAETFFLPILLIITLCSFYFAGDKAPRDKHLPKDMVLIPGDSITGPFYISTHEETNRDYWAYVQWTKCVFEWDFPAVYHATLPDTNVWSSHFSFNDPFVNIYHRHPAYWYYPVVGVSWVQANDYCRWKTDRLNEVTLSGKKMLEFNPYSTNWDNFSTEAFIFGQYETGIIPKRMDYTNFERQLWKDGLVSPSYRLPTEYEWELAYAYDLSLIHI